ncbi:hypothetical protein O181_012516 [Austropuccinia psidii MF-1]|uniref:Uncharacterized protein n=1 Tax=Austropuccinia psidii MF-1 TaxID=1389203 RepID=A0A9Q3BUR8_9BASI|nr:hypothetical protein [Austropuccinia psidii MF-1]
MSEPPEKICLIIFVYSESPSLFVNHSTKYMVELPYFPSFEWFFLVIDTPNGEDLISGFDSIYNFNPSIDWRKGLIAFNYYYKDSRNSSITLSNYFPSENTSESLVEIKEFGEDHSISSLDLFNGNVDLPPSSYYDSLEELWDEKEEPERIETVMKFFPSSYHSYFDILSKMEAENLPPHCACHHHIELEGSLPPVRVIYSL